MAKKNARRKPLTGGYKPERPILSIRFDAGILADLKAEAAARGITVTDVIHNRVLQYERREIISKYVKKVRELTKPAELKYREAAWQQIERKDVEEKLRRLGYTRIVGSNGAFWAEPGAMIPAGVVKAVQEIKRSVE